MIDDMLDAIRLDNDGIYRWVHTTKSPLSTREMKLYLPEADPTANHKAYLADLARLRKIAFPHLYS